MKQFDITVKIRVTVLEGDSLIQYQEACVIGNQYAEMALKYKSIGADEILEVTAKETDNV